MVDLSNFIYLVLSLIFRGATMRFHPEAGHSANSGLDVGTLLFVSSGLLSDVLSSPTA